MARKEGEGLKFTVARSRGDIWAILMDESRTKVDTALIKLPWSGIPDEVYTNTVASNFNSIYFCHPIQELFCIFTTDLRSFDLIAGWDSRRRENKRFKTTCMVPRKKYKNGLDGIMRSFRINQEYLKRDTWKQKRRFKS